MPETVWNSKGSSSNEETSKEDCSEETDAVSSSLLNKFVSSELVSSLRKDEEGEETPDSLEDDKEELDRLSDDGSPTDSELAAEETSSTLEEEKEDSPEEKEEPLEDVCCSPEQPERISEVRTSSDLSAFLLFISRRPSVRKKADFCCRNDYRKALVLLWIRIKDIAFRFLAPKQEKRRKPCQTVGI